MLVTFVQPKIAYIFWELEKIIYITYVSGLFFVTGTRIDRNTRNVSSFVVTILKIGPIFTNYGLDFGLLL